jgi:heat shock protein HslJ
VSHRRKSGSSIDNGQSCNTGCGSGRKKRINPGQGISASQTDRQQQEQAADQDGQTEKYNGNEQWLEEKALSIHEVTVYLIGSFHNNFFTKTDKLNPQKNKKTYLLFFNRDHNEKFNFSS